MLRWTDLTQIPAGFGPTVVTLGNFDGVHRGHQAVLETVVREAAARSAHRLALRDGAVLAPTVEVAEERVRSVAVTFEPHPVAVLHPDRAPAMLMSTERRLELLARSGLDAALVLPFTRELASWTTEEFAVRVFVRALGATALVVGLDTRLGVNNSGDVETLRAVGREHGFEVIALDDVGSGSTRSGGRQWSSTRVRELVAAGDVAGAAEVLGRPHRVSGVVVHGHHRGRGLGYPTANLAASRVGEPSGSPPPSPDGETSGLVPADGVYAGWFERLDLDPRHPDRRLPAAVSVGTNPTFDDVSVRTVEAYVLDRTDLELYGETVAVDFVERLRGMGRFETVEELLDQMADDVERARAVLAPGRDD